MTRVAFVAALLVACSAAPPPSLTPSPSPRVEPGSFEIDVLDVGTGLSVLARGADFTLLYDAGSNDDLATGDGNRVLAYLKAFHVASIDHAILSHPHQDHVQLFADVLVHLHVGDVWDSGAVNPICGYRSFLAAVAERHVRYHSARGEPIVDFGAEARCGGSTSPASLTLPNVEKLVAPRDVRLGDRATMRFLRADGGDHAGRYNENTLVVRLDLDGSRVLLMGDAEAGGRKDPSERETLGSAEAEVLARGASEVRADVLVVGHHGSKTSTRIALLDAVAPKVAVISSGPHKYASVTLPDPEIVALLEARTRLFRTDVDDAACASSRAKIGADGDGKPGGCDAVRVVLRAGRVPEASYVSGP